MLESPSLTMTKYHGCFIGEIDYFLLSMKIARENRQLSCDKITGSFTGRSEFPLIYLKHKHPELMALYSSDNLE